MTPWSETLRRRDSPASGTPDTRRSFAQRASPSISPASERAGGLNRVSSLSQLSVPAGSEASGTTPPMSLQGYSPLSTPGAKASMQWPAIYRPQLEMIHASWGHIQSEVRPAPLLHTSRAASSSTAHTLTLPFPCPLTTLLLTAPSAPAHGRRGGIAGDGGPFGH